MAIKSFKIGSVNKKKDGNGTSIKLGSPNKNPKYATTVEIIVRDSQGNVLARKKDGDYLTVRDPREREGITEEQAAKIPDFVLKDVVAIISDDN